MKYFCFIFFVQQCCLALTCIPTSQLIVDNPHRHMPARSAYISLNEEGDIAVIWKDYRIRPDDDAEDDEYDFTIEEYIKAAVSKNEIWSISQITQPNKIDIHALQCKIDDTGDVTATWRAMGSIIDGYSIETRKKQNADWENPFPFAPQQKYRCPFPLVIDDDGKVVFLPSHESINSWIHVHDIAIGISETGKKFCFWDQNKELNTFSEAWKENDGDWQVKEVFASHPYFKGIGDLRIAIDAKENACIVGTAFSPFDVKEKRAVWAWMRSANGTWSNPTFISDGANYIQELHIAADREGNFLIIWQTDVGLYASYKTQDKDWSSPMPITANSEKDFIFEENLKPLLQVGPTGQFILIWQHCTSEKNHGFLQASVYSSVFSREQEQWSSPQLLTKEETCLLLSFAMNKKGEGVAVWEVLDPTDIKKGYLQVSKISTQ